MLTSCWLTTTTSSPCSYFLLGEISSAQERNAQRAEIILIDATEVGVERLVNRNGWTAFYSEGQIVKLATQR